MVIIYDCALTEPPSSVYCFRDITLYSEIFLKNDNLVKCPKGTRTMYWSWLKQHGAHDFLQEIILDDEDQSGVRIGTNETIKFSILNESSLAELVKIISNLN